MTERAARPSNPFSKVLAPVAARMPRSAREIEILRVSAQLDGDDHAAAVDAARRAVLRWAQRRAVGRLSQDAWDFREFEHLAGGGRYSGAVRIETDDADVWALRQDDPDKDVAGRVWTTEAVVGGRPGERAHVSLRLLVSTIEPAFAVEPHVPGPVLQMIQVPGLVRGGRPLFAEPRPVESEMSAEDLCDHLLDATRRLPIVVISTAGDDVSETMIDGATVAKAVAGMARVVILPDRFSWTLTRRLGRHRSVFGGAVRLYLPDFSETDDPYRHRLFLADHLVSPDEVRACETWLRRTAASASISTHRLGRDVPEFARLKTNSRRLAAERLRTTSAPDAELLRTAEELIESLEAQLAAKDREIDGYVAEVEAAEERADASERDYRALLYRFRGLQERTRDAGVEAPEETPLPTAWPDFVDWVEEAYSDRVLLTPWARKMVRGAAFEDVETVARAIRWLATEAYQRRLAGGGTLRDAIIEEGIRNTLCGGDEYQTTWRGRNHTVDWHMKNGGNTRDPRRCLRIYYFWEPDGQNFVIDHLPSHRITDAT